MPDMENKLTSFDIRALSCSEKDALIQSMRQRLAILDKNAFESRDDKANGTTANAVVKFKGDFLGHLIDAVALVELLEFVIKHHEETDFNKPRMLGMSILVEQIKALLNIEANLCASDY